LFNSSEKRLARILLMLAHFGKEGVPETMVPKISQETLAEMVGTTRSRVSFFMNRYRKLGFIDYAGGVEGGLSTVHYLDVVLHDKHFPLEPATREGVHEFLPDSPPLGLPLFELFLAGGWAIGTLSVLFRFNSSLMRADAHLPWPHENRQGVHCLPSHAGSSGCAIEHFLKCRRKMRQVYGIC
jgi:hypothetical protein